MNAPAPLALHVITGLGRGGAEAMLGKLVRSGDADRAVVVSMTDLGVVGPLLSEAGIRVHALGMRRGRLSLAGLVRLARLVAEVKPDVILGWMYHANIAALAARALSRSRAVLMWNIRHTPDDLREERRLTAATIRLGARLSAYPTRIIYNARVSLERHVALGYDRRNGVVIPNGFDVDEFVPSAERRAYMRRELRLSDEWPVVGLIARFHAMKDHAGFLQAAALVREQLPNARFVLAGPQVDDANSQLTALRDALGLRDNVVLLGSRADVHELLPALDVLCLSSAWGEGFPNVLGEAMACGVPCVTTDVGDAGMIVGETGRVVPRQSPVALADACVDLLRVSGPERSALGQAARARVVAHFSLRDVVSAYQTLFTEATTGSIRGTRGV